MQNKPQVIFIHGGDAFRNPEDLYKSLRARDLNPYEVRKKWKEELIKNLEATHECHSLSMPNAMWADYEAWKIWFEKYLPFLRDGVVLVGHSLGGAFLFRYLSENTLSKSISQVHLISPVIEKMEDCEGFYIDIEYWTCFKTDIKELHLWHSSDDAIVPIHHSELFLSKYPSAIFHRFSDKGHFLIESFPELENAITQQY